MILLHIWIIYWQITELGEGSLVYGDFFLDFDALAQGGGGFRWTQRLVVEDLGFDEVIDGKGKGLNNCLQKLGRRFFETMTQIFEGSDILILLLSS